MGEEQAAESAAIVNGHEVVYRGHRFTCLSCGARLLQIMQFKSRECPGPRPSQEDQMALAVRAMAHHAGEASRIDRTGWTAEQWIEDAERLMGDLDGSVMSLVNGHVLALLDFWRTHRSPG